MDNEQDYIELYKLLARCKFNIAKEQTKLNSVSKENASIIEYFDEKVKQINEFIVDIPIIIKGDEI